MSNISSITFRVVLCCIVFACFVLPPLKSRYRSSVWKTVFLAAVLILITVSVSIVFLSTGKYLAEYSTVGILLWIASAVFIFHLMINGSYLEILFIIMVVLNLYVNIMSIVKTVAYILGIYYLSDLKCVLITVAVVVIYLPLLWVLFIRLYKKVVEFGTNLLFWRYIWLIPALTYMIFYVKIIDDYWRTPIVKETEAILFIILWSFVTYTLFWVTLEMLIQAYKGIVAAEHLKLISSQLSMQEGQYKKLMDSMENTSRLRHDWRHHLLSISGFAEREEIEELKAYLKTLYPEYMSDHGTVFCGNHTVNIILQHNMAVARAKNIHMDIQVNIPEVLGIAYLDLCIIFGNLMENAMDACMKITEEDRKKKIEVRSEKEAGHMTIMMRNTYCPPISVRNGSYYSTKHSGPGVGIPSVKKVVEKYNGNLKIEHDQEYFSIFLLLNIKG